MDYRGAPGRNTGAGLAAALAALKGAPGKKVCFLFSTGKSTDDVSAPAKAMVKSGISIFAIGIGKGASQPEMKTISRYYLVSLKWKDLLFSLVKVQNSLKKGDFICCLLIFVLLFVWLFLPSTLQKVFIITLWENTNLPFSMLFLQYHWSHPIPKSLHNNPTLPRH